MNCAILFLKNRGIKHLIIDTPSIDRYDDNGKLVDDLVVKEHENSIHILNAVSPGMTCSMPFADHIIENYINKLNFKEK